LRYIIFKIFASINTCSEDVRQTNSTEIFVVTIEQTPFYTYAKNSSNINMLNETHKILRFSKTIYP